MSWAGISVVTRMSYPSSARRPRSGRITTVGEAHPVGVRRDLLHVPEVDDIATPGPAPFEQRLLSVVPFAQTSRAGTAWPSCSLV